MRRSISASRTCRRTRRTDSERLPELHRLEASATTLDRLVFSEAGRVLQRFLDVRGLEVGIRCQDLIGRLPRREQAEQPCHRKAKIPDTWLSRTDIGADGDARESHVTPNYGPGSQPCFLLGVPLPGRARRRNLTRLDTAS